MKLKRVAGVAGVVVAPELYVEGRVSTRREMKLIRSDASATASSDGVVKPKARFASTSTGLASERGVVYRSSSLGWLSCDAY